ncbi:hypothetical protein Fmac_001305 [Flemingia macrophylla]|uniref:K+ potassium transporter integral membrane domain-containing protein n=1 Tax=Flemingia macrophylla TaxID=520843 RepID=A0ABD1NGR4_9FABA
MVNINEQVEWKTTIALAFQSIGIVYGDIGTSPLYVFSGIFTERIRHNDDILGVLSLIIYTIIIIPFLKYILVVLHVNDHGNEAVMGISVAILVILFSVQRFGTDRDLRQCLLTWVTLVCESFK